MQNNIIVILLTACIYVIKNTVKTVIIINILQFIITVFYVNNVKCNLYLRSKLNFSIITPVFSVT